MDTTGLIFIICMIACTIAVGEAFHNDVNNSNNHLNQKRP